MIHCPIIVHFINSPCYLFTFNVLCAITDVSLVNLYGKL